MEQTTIKKPMNKSEMMPQDAHTAPVAKKKGGSVVDYLNGEQFKNQLAMALPKFLDTDHFVRSAISDFRLNPALQECSVPSVLGFYMQAAMCGLEPASILGQCYPVPFNNSKTKQKECQFIMSYRGMLSLARRSGEILSVDAQIVYEKDEFTLEYGLNANITHKPYIDGDPGEMRGAYVVVKFRDGSYQFKFMPKAEIEAHRRRSKASGFGPWKTDYNEMAKKTVFRAMFKWLPISIEQATAMASDEAVSKLNVNAQAAEDLVEVEFVAAQYDGAGQEETVEEAVDSLV